MSLTQRSGSVTIMWQSINISGTAFFTDEMMGAPMTIFGTKCLRMGDDGGVVGISDRGLGEQ